MITVRLDPLFGWGPADAVVDEAALLGLRRVTRYRADEVSENPNGEHAVLEYWERMAPQARGRAS